jgi:hypothetical protein
MPKPLKKSLLEKQPPRSHARPCERYAAIAQSLPQKFEAGKAL